jgi:hypothetical protein
VNITVFWHVAICRSACAPEMSLKVTTKRPMHMRHTPLNQDSPRTHICTRLTNSHLHTPHEHTMPLHSIHAYIRKTTLTLSVSLYTKASGHSLPAIEGSGEELRLAVVAAGCIPGLPLQFLTFREPALMAITPCVLYNTRTHRHTQTHAHTRTHTCAREAGKGSEGGGLRAWGGAGGVVGEVVEVSCQYRALLHICKHTQSHTHTHTHTHAHTHTYIHII